MKREKKKKVEVFKCKARKRNELRCIKWTNYAIDRSLPG
jgi:hypothetical protein